MGAPTAVASTGLPQPAQKAAPGIIFNATVHTAHRKISIQPASGSDPKDFGRPTQVACRLAFPKLAKFKTTVALAKLA